MFLLYNKKSGSTDKAMKMAIIAKAVRSPPTSPMYPTRIGDTEPNSKAPVHKYANVLPSISGGAIELIRASLAGAAPQMEAPSMIKTKSSAIGDKSTKARAKIGATPSIANAIKTVFGSYLSTSWPHQIEKKAAESRVAE